VEFDTGVQTIESEPPRMWSECGQSEEHPTCFHRGQGGRSPKSSMPIEVSEIVRAVGLEPTVGEPTRS
jgi:hypothetical protein